jgi:hypothetical protein
MNVLLLSMPGYFEHMPPVAVRMPNGALTSLAGSAEELEYLRWKVERWMQVRHMPAVFCHNPWFVCASRS